METENIFSQNIINYLKSRMIDGVLREFRNVFSLVSGYTEMAAESLINEKNNEFRMDLAEILKGCKKGVEVLNTITNLSRGSKKIALCVSSKHFIKELSDTIRMLLPKSVVIDLEVRNLHNDLFIDSTSMQQVVLVLLFKILDVDFKPHERKYLKISANEIISNNNRYLDIKINVLPSTIEQKRQYEDRNFLNVISENDFIELQAIAETNKALVHLPETISDNAVSVEIPLSFQSNETTIPLYKGHQRGHGQIILVVDDEISVAEVTASKLERLGYSTIVENSPINALKLLRNRSVCLDLLITDQIMPEMTGLELIQQATIARQDLKIVMITGYASGVTQAVCKKYGISALAMKPLDEGELAVLVARQFPNFSK